MSKDKNKFFNKIKRNKILYVQFLTKTKLPKGYKFFSKYQRKKTTLYLNSRTQNRKSTSYTLIKTFYFTNLH